MGLKMPTEKGPSRIKKKLPKCVTRWVICMVVVWLRNLMGKHGLPKRWIKLLTYKMKKGK